MKTLVLSACAAALIATAGAPASAGQFTVNDNGPSGPIISVGDYYDRNYQSPEGSNYESDYSYGDRGNGYGYDNGYGNGGYGRGYGNGYGNGGYGYGYGYWSYRVVSPYAIMRYLQRNNFTYISQPVLAGRVYQVKARDPRGHRVKLYVDAYNARIVKVKY